MFIAPTHELLCYYRFHRDKHCVAWFVEKLRNLAYRVKYILSANVPMETLSSKQWERGGHFATRCNVTCMRNRSRRMIHDHCHLTGRYRGLAYSNYNLNYKDSHCIPVVFYNLSGYNAHFIIKIAFYY